MKPRILILMHYMELGGAERALIGLLEAFDVSKVSVDLFVYRHTGAFMSFIPNKVNLLPENPVYAVVESPMKEVLLRKKWGIFWGRLIGKLRYSWYLYKKKIQNEGSASHYAFDGMISFLPSLRYLGHYNLAISFLDPPHVVQDKVDADIKLEWVHTDFSTVNMDVAKTIKRWEKNDYIVSISSSVTEQFLKTYPTLQNKIIEIHNILSPKFVRGQASAGMENLEIKFNATKKEYILVSVGRICYQKNFECIPSVCRILKDRGLKFHWYVIGPGNHDYIDKMGENMETIDCFDFLGPKNNPYPYISACDLYIQPSRYEGHSVTVREAQILYKPVVVTNYATVQNQVKNGEDGVICGMNNEEIAEAIIELLKNEKKIDHIKEYLQSHDYGNESEVDKIYEILGI
ncbi:MAG: glycosyltransferase [Bacteroidaceae bacterium]|nr:glycosyltransferase [Bacteroidaceae bacterium]